MAELTKYCIGKQVEMLRSEINFATYNPRKINDESAATLKRGIKKHGLLGELVVNKTTGNTLVSGHQRITQLDKLEKYNPDTHENDYKVRVNLIEVDGKSEKEIVVLMNNPNAQGDWDYDKLRQIVPDIDYKDAGLTDADLSMIGINYVDSGISPMMAIDDMITPMMFEPIEPDMDNRTQHVKDIKKQQMENALAFQDKMEAYITLSFSSGDKKRAFCGMMEIGEYDKYADGDKLLKLLE